MQRAAVSVLKNRVDLESTILERERHQAGGHALYNLTFSYPVALECKERLLDWSLTDWLAASGTGLFFFN
jgi:hypothetical protein